MYICIAIKTKPIYFVSIRVLEDNIWITSVNIAIDIWSIITLVHVNKW